MRSGECYCCQRVCSFFLSFQLSECGKLRVLHIDTLKCFINVRAFLFVEVYMLLTCLTQQMLSVVVKHGQDFLNIVALVQCYLCLYY